MMELYDTDDVCTKKFILAYNEHGLDYLLTKILHHPTILYRFMHLLVTREEFQILEDVAKYLVDHDHQKVPGIYLKIDMAVMVIRLLETQRGGRDEANDANLDYYYSLPALQSWMSITDKYPSPYLENYINENHPGDWNPRLFRSRWFSLLRTADNSNCDMRWRLVMKALSTCPQVPRCDIDGRLILFPKSLALSVNFIKYLCSWREIIPILFQSITCSTFENDHERAVNHKYLLTMVADHTEILREHQRISGTHILIHSVVQDKAILRKLLETFSPNYDERTLTTVLTCEDNFDVIACYLESWRESSGNCDYRFHHGFLSSEYVEHILNEKDNVDALREFFITGPKPAITTIRVFLIVLMDAYCPLGFLQEFMDHYPELVTGELDDYWEMILALSLHNEDDAVIAFVKNLLGLKEIVLSENMIVLFENGFTYEGYVSVEKETLLDYHRLRRCGFVIRDSVLKSLLHVIVWHQSILIYREIIEKNPEEFKGMILHQYLLQRGKNRDAVASLVREYYSELDVHELLAPSSQIIEFGMAHYRECISLDEILEKPMMHYHQGHMIVIGELDLIDGFQWYEDGIQYYSYPGRIMRDLSRDVIKEYKSEYLLKFSRSKNAR